MHAVFLKPNKEESVRRFHPWVFSGAIQKLMVSLQKAIW
jgi:23S rRNA (cytosine1962-C5)-methyltransferase